MALGSADLAEMETLLAAQADAPGAIGELRRRFPGMAITRCDPSDVDLETPCVSVGRFSLYLVDGADHCWRLTSDPRRATGMVVVTNRTPT